MSTSLSTPTLRHRRSRITAGIVAAVAVTLSGLAASNAAYAATPYEELIPDDGRDLGALIVTLKPGATANDPYPIQSVTTAPDALPLPTGNREQGAEILQWDNNVDLWGPFFKSTDPIAAGRGLDGNTISYSDSPAAHIGGFVSISDRLEWTADGNFKYVLAFSANNFNIRPHQDGVVFYSATLHVDQETGVLSVVNGPPVDKIATSFTDVAVTAKTATSATLSATISPADATGDVTFTSGDKTVKGTLSGGVATASVSGLTPNQEYTFTASYAENATHLGTSKDVTFTTEPAEEPKDSATAEIGANVPAATATTPTGLKLTAKPGAVTLTGVTPTRAEGTVWETIGQLGDVTVNDDRRTVDVPWSLTGKSGVFADGEKKIQASNLGWKPTLGTGPGVVGGEVVAGADGGLSTDRVLVSGTGSTDPNQATTAGAGLTLRVPADAEQGNYSATLTLTLI